MQITVLLFANLAEAAGRESLSLDLPEGAAVAEAIDRLAAEHSAIASLRATLAVAVNDRYASLNMPLEDGCTLALIPPVSGG